MSWLTLAGKKEKEVTRPRGIAVTSVLYQIYCILNLAIFGISKLTMYYIGVLGVLCLVAAIGLWLVRRWGFLIALAIAPIIITIGLSTLYASILFFGFIFDANVVILYLSLICYTIIAFVLLCYLLSKRRVFS